LALFHVARRGGLENEIDGHLALAKSLFENPGFRKLLGSPRVRVEAKMEVLRRGLEGVVNPLILRLFELLLDRKRVEYLPDISTSFTKVLEESKGIARADVRTSIALDAETEKKLRDALEGVTGKQILMEKHVDPSLIGGVLVRIGDQLLDSTVRTRLKEMKEKLLAVKVH